MINRKIICVQGIGFVGAAMMAVTSVNIGNRQEGRILSDTVISVKTDKIEIAKVIKSVLRKKKKHTIQHPFG